MKWLIEGADRKTGEDVSLVLSAENRSEALADANKRNILVSKINAVGNRFSLHRWFKLILIGAIVFVAICGTTVAAIYLLQIKPSDSLGTVGSSIPATTEQTVNPPIIAVNAELSRLRQENIQLRQQIELLKRQQTVTQAVPATPPPSITPKELVISGAAYVVRQNGQSDILRGFRVTLIQDTVPSLVFQNALTTVIHNFTNKAATLRKEAADERKKWADMKLSSSSYDPGKYSEDEAKEAEAKAQKYSRILSQISNPIDSVNALKLLNQTGYVNVIWDLVSQIRIASTTTDVQGIYKFANAPANSYVFAMFDTRDGFLMWAIPCQDNGSKDLFNDTALPQ